MPASLRQGTGLSHPCTVLQQQQQQHQLLHQLLLLCVAKGQPDRAGNTGLVGPVGPAAAVAEGAA
jgi:hypothetical protein